MKRIAAFLLGLTLAIGLGAYAVTGGGFPSFPRFQGVTVGTATAATTGNLSISGSMTAGSVPDARLSANVPLKNAANTFAASQVVHPAAGNGSLQVVASTTGTAGQVQFADINTGTGNICISDVANICEPNIAGHVLDISGNTGIQLTVGGSVLATGTNSSLNFTSAATIGAKTVCLSDGTNCPVGKTISYELTSAGGTVAPTITYCNRCSSPSIARVSAGLWTFTPGITLTGQWAVSCTEINTGNTGYYIQAGGTGTGATTISMGISSLSGTTLTATDPVAAVGFACIASN